MSDKRPQAGEFWEWAGCRLRIIGTRSNGAIVAEHECGSLEFGCTFGEMKHLPDCDSFDWHPETFPQWCVCGNDHGWGITAYVVRDTPKTYFCVEQNGETKESPDYTWDQELVNCGFWKQVTQAEAESRVKKPEPVESPDDWVTQDRVPYRRQFDECRWGDSDKWLSDQNTPEHYQHGYEGCGALRRKLEVRCRRRDLPPMPQETHRRKLEGPTGIEAIVCADIAERERLGVAKYGTTVKDNPLARKEWAQHAYEECLDQAVYLRRLIDEL